MPGRVGCFGVGGGSLGLVLAILDSAPFQIRQMVFHGGLPLSVGSAVLRLGEALLCFLDLRFHSPAAPVNPRAHFQHCPGLMGERLVC